MECFDKKVKLVSVYEECFGKKSLFMQNTDKNLFMSVYAECFDKELGFCLSAKNALIKS